MSKPAELSEAQRRVQADLEYLTEDIEAARFKLFLRPALESHLRRMKNDPALVAEALDNFFLTESAQGLACLAEVLARQAHAGQYRRDGSTPYINHPARVAELVAPTSR